MCSGFMPDKAKELQVGEGKRGVGACPFADSKELQVGGKKGGPIYWEAGPLLQGKPATGRHGRRFDPPLHAHVHLLSHTSPPSSSYSSLDPFLLLSGGAHPA